MGYENIGHQHLPSSELERKTAALEEFAVKVSHDLKSPLMAIGAAAATLTRRLGQTEDDTTRTLLGTIEGSVADLQRRIDDVLQLCRLGMLTGELEAVPMRDVIEEVLLRNQTAIGAADAQLCIGPLPTLRVDRHLIVETIENLLTNALRYARPPGRLIIEIGAEQRSDETHLYVRDNGRGIDPAFRPKAFDLHTTADESAGGSGVGLALVKRAVEAHAGRAWIADRPDNTPGAEIRIAFPIGCVVDPAIT